MKLSKRILSIALAAIMVPAVLAGCGKTEGTTSDNGVKKVIVWRNSGHDKSFMQEKFKIFNDTIGKERGIALEYVTKEGDLEEMLNVAYTTDQAPDLFNTWQIEARAQKDQLAAYEDIKGMVGLLEKYGKYVMEIRHKYQGKTLYITKNIRYIRSYL